MNLDELKKRATEALALKATRGPWEAVRDDERNGAITYAVCRGGLTIAFVPEDTRGPGDDSDAKVDAAFIAAARASVPALARAVISLAAVVEALPRCTRPGCNSIASFQSIYIADWRCWPHWESGPEFEHGKASWADAVRLLYEGRVGDATVLVHEPFVPDSQAAKETVELLSTLATPSWSPPREMPLLRMKPDSRSERWKAAEARIAEARSRHALLSNEDLAIVAEEQAAWDAANPDPKEPKT